MIRTLLLVSGLCALLIVAAYSLQKGKRARTKKPGQFTRYISPKYSAQQCRDFLSHKNIHDLFEYTIESDGGREYILFTKYLPTQQIVETVFLLEYEQQEPAVFTLRFVREAFGYREPVFPPAFLDEFFYKKLEAVPDSPQENTVDS